MNVIDDEGIAYPSTLNVKVWVGDENIAQFFRPIVRISRDVKGIVMKSCVYNEGLNLWWGYCRPYRLATNFLPCIDENIVWFFRLIVMVYSTNEVVAKDPSGLAI
jgi:hypothetical protein